MSASGNNSRKKMSAWKKWWRKHHLRQLFRRKKQNLTKLPWSKRLLSITGKILLRMLILLGIILVFFDQFLYLAIVTVGSAIAGADISLDDVETSFRRGDIKVINLRISNPDGFSQDKLLGEAAYIYLSVDKSSLFTKEIVFREVELRNVSAYGEINPAGELNLQKFADKLRRYRSESEADSGKCVVFNFIRLDNISVSIADQRQEHKLNGTGVFLKHAGFYPHEGKAQLNTLCVTPPDKYSGKLLEIDSVAVNFPPDIFHATDPRINHIAVDGIRANIGLNGNKHSNVYEISRYCHTIFFSDPAPQENADSPEGTDSFARLFPVESFCCKNVSLKFSDISRTNSIHGFGVRFEELNGSIKHGKIRLTGFQADNPDGFEENMMNINSLELDFIPESIFSDTPKITLIKIDSIRAGIGFREDNQSNLYAVYHSAAQLLRPWYLIYGSSDQNDFTPEIGGFIFSDINLTVRDKRKNNNINGLCVYIKSLQGSVCDGNAALFDLQVYPPAGYHRNMLDVKSLSVKFLPESVNSDNVIINDIKADGIKVTAGLNKFDQSNLQEVIDTVEFLISSLSAADNSAADSGSETRFTIRNCQLKNSSFAISDSRHSGNIQGFAVHWDELTYNLDSGWMFLRKLHIANPRTYYKHNMLTAEEISAKIPQTDAGFTMQNISINKLHAILEYKANGKTNFHEIADTLFIIFELSPPCKRPKPEVKSSTGTEPQTSSLEYFKVSDSTLVIRDQQKRIPLEVPLEIYQKNYQMSGSDATILESIHDNIVELEDNLRGVTDVNKILMDILSSAAQNGIEFVKKSAKNSTNFIMSLFKF